MCIPRGGVRMNDDSETMYLWDCEVGPRSTPEAVQSVLIFVTRLDRSDGLPALGKWRLWGPVQLHTAIREKIRGQLDQQGYAGLTRLEIEQVPYNLMNPL